MITAINWAAYWLFVPKKNGDWIVFLAASLLTGIIDAATILAIWN